jgi:hypothetical protein
MNRRNFIKASSAAALVPLAINSVAASPEPFTPDIVIDHNSPLSRYITVELDGVMQYRTFEARVKWGSFEKPTLGELVNQSEPDEAQPYMHCRGPKEGEFDNQGVWVRCVKGMVEVKVKDQDRAEFDKLLTMFKELSSR